MLNPGCTKPSTLCAIQITKYLPLLYLTIEPLKGVTISSNQEILLGDHIADVEYLIGKPSSTIIIDSPDYSPGSFIRQSFYQELEVRIDYNRFDKVDFIEFLSGPWPEKVCLSIYGINPFSIYWEELVEILTSKNNGRIDSKEAPYAYCFQELGVGIWRDANPKDVEDWINERKSNGTYEVDKEWLDEELEKSRHFWTIGIGDKSYYK